MDFTLTIIGDGPKRCNLLDLIGKFSLGDRIFLRSNLNRKDLLEEYISSNLFVLLSYHEAFSIVVAEAQYLGLNVIVPNASALSEFVEGGYAYGVNLPLTPRKVADAIMRISKLPGTTLRKNILSCIDHFVRIAGDILRLSETNT